jgi:NAD(P)-dependent dehydrogenase (short-subunit alcohol dehydrogenase family)
MAKTKSFKRGFLGYPRNHKLCRVFQSWLTRKLFSLPVGLNSSGRRCRTDLRINYRVAGANRGLGWETAKKILTDEAVAATSHVIVGARDQAKADSAVSTLKAFGANVSSVVLDVANAASIASAATQIDSEYGRLDTLINNAAIYGGDQISADGLAQNFDVNVAGPVRVTEAFFPLLVKSADPRLVFVTSSLSSLTYTGDKGSHHYGPYALEMRVTKAALNMLMVEYANHPKFASIKVLGADPGFLATDFAGDADRVRAMGAVEPEVGAEVLLAIIKGEKDGDVGKVTGPYGVNPW